MTRNEIFETINRMPIALDKIERIQILLDELWAEFLYDDYTDKLFKKATKKTDKLYNYFSSKAKEAIKELKQCNA